MDGAFEIYSLADGLFMYRVLNAVAMLGNAGHLAAVAAIGLLVGLLMLTLNGVLNGGREFPLHQLLLSYILFLVLFGTRATVVIHEVTPSLGASAPVSRTVDNVPWGVAVAGSLISRFSFELTQLTETAFSMPESQGITEIGFGKTLEVLAMGRMFEQAQLTGVSDPKWFDAYRQSLANYLQDCTMTGIAAGIIKPEALWRDEDPLAGFRFESRAQTTESHLPDGDANYVTCVEGYELLNTDSERLPEVLKGAYSNYIGVTDADAAYERALAAVGQAGVSDLRRYSVASMLNAIYTEAMSASPMNSSRTQMAMMLKQAEEQRQVQWAAEEAMFTKVVRPLQAFFESFSYALAPFMAFALGLGAFGLRLLMKYFVLTVWCSLFGIVLAVINLFATTQLEHYISAIAARPDTPLASALGSAEVADQAMNALSFASTLAAATPAITMVLLFGGAVAGTFLASRLQGADHIREQQVAPDVQNIGALQNHEAYRTLNPTNGNTITGSAALGMSMNLADITSRNYATAESEKQAASETASRRMSETITGMVQNAQRWSDGWNASRGHDFSQGDSILAQESKRFGFNVDDTVNSSSGAKLETQKGTRISQQAALLLGASMPMLQAGGAEAGRVLESAKRMGVTGGVLNALRSATGGAGGLGVNTGGSVSTSFEHSKQSTEGYSVADAQTARMLMSFGREISTNESLKAEVAERIARAAQASGGQDASTSATVADGRELSRAAADLREKTTAFTASTEARDTWQSQRQMTDLQWSQLIARTSGGDAFFDRIAGQAQEIVGTRAFEANLDQVRQMHGLTGAEAQGVAALRTLAGGGWAGDRYAAAPGMEDERRIALANALRMGGMDTGGMLGLDAESGRGLGGSVEHGRIERATSGISGPPDTKDQIEGAYYGTQEAAERRLESSKDATGVGLSQAATQAVQQRAESTFRNEIQPEAATAREHALDNAEGRNKLFPEIRRDRSVIGAGQPAAPASAD